MIALHRALLVIAVFQAVSTLIGFVQLLFTPHFYAPMLDSTPFAGRFVEAAVLLGVVVGGFQWAAVLIHLRMRRRALSAHAFAGLVMVGWIGGECLVLDSFIWPHALWGGLGVLQMWLVLVLLGVLTTHEAPGSTGWSNRGPVSSRPGA